MKMKFAVLSVILIMGCDVHMADPTNDERSAIETLPNEIEYRGQRFQMSRSFADYEEYSDTADRIAEQDHEKVADAVRRATVPDTVASIEEMSRVTGDVAFPGFQSGTLVVKDKTQFGQYYGMHAMIPYTDFSRFFIYAQRDGHLQLIHEAELETFPSVYHFSVSDEKIVYHRSNGKIHEFARNERTAEL